MLIHFDYSDLTARVVSGRLKSSHTQRVSVRTYSEGVATELPAGASISLKLKPRAERDTDNLLATATFVQDGADDTLYEATVDAYTTAAVALLGLADSDTSNDILSYPCDLVVLYRTSSGTAWPDAEESETMELDFESAINLPDDAAPTALPTASAWLTARAIRFDIAQTLSDAARIQALANQGITFVTGGYLRFEDASGDVFHLGLNTGEPPA